MDYSGNPSSADTVNIIANFQPLAQPYAGPNYYQFSDAHFYEILVDNFGKGRASVRFQFQFTNEYTPLNLNVGGQSVEIPLKFAGQVQANSEGNLFFQETYKVRVVTRRSALVINQATSGTTFEKAFDYAGPKTFPDYASYRATKVYDVKWPSNLGNKCDQGKNVGKIFVGPAKDPFYIYLGGVFDLVNFNPLGIAQDYDKNNQLKGSNSNIIAIQIHKSCLLYSTDPAASAIGVWVRTRAIDTGVQVARLGMPLINELFIGFSQKDQWNKDKPQNDQYYQQFYDYPTLPAILDILFGGANSPIQPTQLPRNDLSQLLLLGVPTITDLYHQRKGVVFYQDLLRLNTDTTGVFTPVPLAQQKPLGFLALDQNNGLSPDFAGFPNGRRPMDDIVDIYLRAAMGALYQFTAIFDPTDSGKNAAKTFNALFTDGTPPNMADYTNSFPWLALPLPGSYAQP